MQTTKINPWVVCGRIFFTFCLAATILFIFSNSRQVAEISAQHSQEVLAQTQGVLDRVGLSGIAAGLTEHTIRKLAHFAEYMLEGFWLMLCTRVYTRRFVRHISWPILGGLFTALCDETIQMFSAGRSSQLTDVWLDFAGVMAGLIAGFLVLCIFRMFSILWRHRNEV